MSAFPHEYAIDAELQDMFGHNASLLVNSVVQQVAPPTETVATVVPYRNVADLEQATATIEAAISAHGHCLLRYQGDAPVRPESLVTQLRRTLRIAKPIDYARAGGTDVRPAVDGSDAVFATDFPPTSAIPPHHELLYSPVPRARRLAEPSPIQVERPPSLTAAGLSRCSRRARRAVSATPDSSDASSRVIASGAAEYSARPLTTLTPPTTRSPTGVPCWVTSGQTRLSIAPAAWASGLSCSLRAISSLTTRTRRSVLEQARSTSPRARR